MGILGQGKFLLKYEIIVFFQSSWMMIDEIISCRSK
jgi:hypothetical protein